jgi:photosystem II stability/assembly factor-like uncharacterized protein
VRDYCAFIGLAGDTEPGRFLSSGMYRSFGPSGAWESLADRFDESVQVRSILTDVESPGRVTVGTQLGLLRSEDYGEHWRALSAPHPGRAVWSLAKLPSNPQALLVGYEPCAIFCSSDNGESWTELSVNAQFPDISTAADTPKRVTSLAGDPWDTGQFYATIEVGGLIRSKDSGASWTSVIDGLYVNDDAVDLHSVLLDPARPGVVLVATRVGLFESTDCGARWRKLPVPATSTRGVYCRSMAYAPDDPRTIYLGAGEGFEGDLGVFLISRDAGDHWNVPSYGAALKSTVFCVVTHPRYPDYVWFSSKYGDVFRSMDRGRSWHSQPLPRGIGHVFAMGIA